MKGRPSRKKSLALAPEAEALARARARARSEQREVQLAESGISDLAVAIRRIVVERSGRVTRRELADALGITVTEVVRSLTEIRSTCPIEKPQYVEQREIDSALAFWDEVEALIFHDLIENEALSQAWSANPIFVTLTSTRIGLLNQLQLVRTNRIKFLQDVGMLRRSAAEINLNVRAVEALDGEALDAELEDIDRRIREIEENGADAIIYRSGIVDAEAEEVSNRAEEAD